MKRKSIRGFTLVELLVVIAIIGIMIAMALPAIQGVRETSRRLTCTNHLARLGLALQNYEAANECLPPGVIDSKGPIHNTPEGQHVAWLVQILPYIEEGNVYRRIDQAAGVYDKKNAAVRETPLNELLCPSEIGSVSPVAIGPGVEAKIVSPPGISSYAGCHHDVEAPIDADNHGVLFLNSHIRPKDITDGLARTFFVGEKRIDLDDLGWMSGTRATLRNTGTPLNQTAVRPIVKIVRPPAPSQPFYSPPTATGGVAKGDSPRPTFGRYPAERKSGQSPAPSEPPAALPPDVGGFGSAHPGGANFLFGDGSIRFLADAIDASLYRQFGNRADGELPKDARE